MDAHSVVDDWDAVPFDGGFGAIDELSKRGFNGAIEADGTWLFLRAGDPIAVISDFESNPHPGEIETFERSSGQRYEAPNAAVSTLAAMLALDGDVRGRYFSDDTPLEAVDETLSEGGFTGYVELSENVLSGDYYFIYFDGDVDHVGFVGSAQRLYGDDAEERANGEVGIYAVVAVTLPRPELPDPPAVEGEDQNEQKEPQERGAAVSSGVDTGADSATESSATTEAEADELKADAEAGPDATARHEATSETGSESESESESENGSESQSDPDSESDIASTLEAEPTPESEPTLDTDTEAEPTETEKEPPAQGVVADSADPEQVSDRASAASADEQAADDNIDTTSHETVGDDSGAVSADPDEPSSAPSSESTREGTRQSDGIEAVTTRTIPSLDPENSGRSEDTTETTTVERASSRRSPQSAVSDSTSQRSERKDPPVDRIERVREEYESRIDEYESRVDEYESQIETYESKIETLETELDGADSRIEELQAKLHSIRNERDELQRRIDSGDDLPAGKSLTAGEALRGTNLFIRETTRGEATLADACRGAADRETVASNIRIEYHTEFEDDEVLVDGEPFESWLRSSETHAFVEWLVMELLFEIWSTDATTGLQPLYEALPEIDRVGFDETISIENGADGREVPFDIIARNKKGNPLVVVTFDRQRDPTRAETIEPLVTDASDVCDAYDSLVGAIAITSSYFEADAMATVEEATSTSLLSRSKYRSYVKLSRASGYHLCLVETRDGSFTLTVPEL